ncbi:hypothetical protein ANO11243_065410 [Dothideomycetidae sp. 11243]|nr:hypothetical protein ANO11243_065410 [fungal sp. No.11243]
MAITKDAVRDSIKQIDQDQWLIAGLFILTRTKAPRPGFLWESADGRHYYSVCAARDPLPTAVALPLNVFEKVHDAGDASAVWDLGEAFLKVNMVHDRKDATDEPTTLRWLAEQKNLSFDFPKVLYYMQHEERIYLIVTRVPGKTLDVVWPSYNDDEKHRCVARVTDIIEELARWRSDSIVGIDGAQFAEPWLDMQLKHRAVHNYSPEAMQEVCEKLGMDCSTFVFCHCDLGPYNIIIDGSPEKVGIIDWEMAGYAPLAWIRTKFGVSWALEFDWRPDEDPTQPSTRRRQKEWRILMAQHLGEMGFPEVMDTWELRLKESQEQSK